MKVKYSSKAILYNVQFKRKLGLKFIVSSKFSIILLVLLFISGLGFLVSSWIYLAVMVIYAKWFFNYSRDKGQFQVFLIKYYCLFQRNILLKIREIA